jgi:hypothetical protein
MIFTRQELESIIENGLNDLDDTDPYQICAKVCLGLAICIKCGQSLEIPLDHISPEDFAAAGNYIKSSGWKCNTPPALGYYDVSIICPKCWQGAYPEN